MVPMPVLTACHTAFYALTFRLDKFIGRQPLVAVSTGFYQGVL